MLIKLRVSSGHFGISCTPRAFHRGPDQPIPMTAPAITYLYTLLYRMRSSRLPHLHNRAKWSKSSPDSLNQPVVDRYSKTDRTREPEIIPDSIVAENQKGKHRPGTGFFRPPLAA